MSQATKEATTQLVQQLLTERMGLSLAFLELCRHVHDKELTSKELYRIANHAGLKTSEAKQLTDKVFNYIERYL